MIKLCVVEEMGGIDLLKKMIGILLAPLLLFSALPVHADKAEERPWKDEIIYSLMVDRFNNGDNNNDYDVNMKDPLSYQGGDFKGIIDRLDYLKDMGFTAIQLSPIFDNKERGYHGEWIVDYNHIEEHFGTMNDFKALVKETHNREMKIILELPITDLESDEGFLDIAKWWIEQTKIDGYKITNVNERPLEYWQIFASNIKKVDNDFYLSGSYPELSHEEMQLYIGAGFDSMLNTPLNEPLRNVFSKRDESQQPLLDIAAQDQTEAGISEAFFDNSYTKRFTNDMVNNNVHPGSSWKIALTYLYTQPEIPVIFYGTEIAVNGGIAPENTPLMNFRTDEVLIDYITDLGRIRQEQVALRRGTLEPLYEKNGMAVFIRQYKEDTIVVAINNTTADQTVILDATQFEEHKELRGILGTDVVRNNDGEFKLVINREESEVYKVVDESGINLPFIFVLFAVFGVFILFMYIVWKRGKKQVIE